MSITAFHNASKREEIKAFPVSYNQEGLWFLDQLKPEGAAYNMSASIHLRGLLNLEAFERSLNTIVQQHEALRTTFRMMEGQLTQIISSTLTLPVPEVDLRGLPEVDREARVQQLAIEEARRPFDLAQGPLVRAIILRLEDEEYLFLLTTHHIISDAWSLRVLFRELTTLYDAFSNDQPSPLPQLPMQYADFAVRQREWLQGDMAADELAYWKQQLAGIPEGLNLPTDLRRLPLPTSRGSTYGLRLPQALSEALKALSRQEGVALYVILVAAFQTLLYRYTGQEDLAIGTVTAGRSRAETENSIGFFESMLVLRTDLSGNPTFHELLWRVRKTILEAQAHQDLPLEYLVKELQPERGFGQNPFFQVSLTFESPLPTLPAGWTLTQMEVETGISRFNLSLDFVDGPENLLGRFTYSTDLFDQSTIVRLAGHLQKLLEGVVEDHTQPITALPLLMETEQHQLLVEWNATEEDDLGDQCIHQLFEAQVERTPDAQAVVFEDEQLTYRELNSKANQLAHHLRQLGVGPEALVGLCVERSLEMVVGLLGIFKAGGAYVPLDPDYPEERLAFMLKDTKAPVLLTQQRLVDRLPEHHPQLVCLDADWQTISQQSETNPINEIGGENLAYVIYTSGSTGQPKGVLIEHRAIAAHCWAITRAYDLRAEDCVLQFSTSTFDASLEQILPTLLVGARLAVRGPEVWSPAELLHKVIVLGLTVINLPPAYWHHVLQEWSHASQQMLGHRLRLVIVGGDRLLPEALHLWLQTPLRSVRLLNAYGPTETTITATLFDITRHLDREELLEKVPIGRPLPNRTTYILDRSGYPVPVGVAGELHIGGNSLARGYLNHPALTAERFIADPFNRHRQARLYKTGDLTRYLADGSIEFLGRVDQQVKIRGFRIELGEIEAVLIRHPKVREAVVSAHEDPRGEKYLVAYVVASEGQVAENHTLRSYLKLKLPEYMIPAAFVQLESLPLMVNGKIDRRALPAPGSLKPIEEKTYVAPTLMEHYQLVRIWEDLLDVRPIGIRDNFFDLGGHSLLAIRMIDRIAQVCSKKLPLSTLFVGATIEYLATVLLEGTVSESRAPLVVAQASGSKRPFFYLHGEWAGGAFYCLELANYLGPDQPLYLLEPYKFVGLPVPPTFEAMAAAYLESLRRIQPEGPYLLGGWCNGGLVAYEMARQLHAQGQTVDLLLLMDSDAPHPLYRRMIRGAIRHLCNLLHLDQDKQLDLFLHVEHLFRYLRFSHYRETQNSKLLEIAEKREPRHMGSRVSRMLPGLRIKALFPPAQYLRQRWQDIYDFIAYAYKPSLYPGKITFFWDSEDQWRSVWWRKLVKAKENDVEVYILPGTHFTLRTRDVRVLGEHLRMCLNKAQKATKS